LINIELIISKATLRGGLFFIPIFHTKHSTQSQLNQGHQMQSTWGSGLGRIRRICRWFFKDGFFFWGFVALVILSIYFYFRHQGRLVTLGTLMQLIGALCLLSAFRQKLNLFKGMPIKKMILEYFLSFPWHGKIHLITASMKFSGRMSANVTVSRKPPEKNLQDVIRYFTQKTMVNC
jgi:hypothetical protein